MAQAGWCLCHTAPALPWGNEHSPEQKNCSSKQQLLPQAPAEQGITGENPPGSG